MPASMSWKEMYRLEYFQMREEGYDTETMPDPEAQADSPLAFHLEKGEAFGQEKTWKAAYDQLAALRAKGIRTDFAYCEPDELDKIFCLADEPPKMTPVAGEVYEDRVRGAWFARCAAVILGKPLEMGFDRLKIKEYLESVEAYPLNDWVPARSEKLDITLRKDCVPSTKGNVQYVQSDDDIHYTICSLLLAEKAGENFTRWDAAENLLDNISYNWVWTADKQLYYQMVNCNSKAEFESWDPEEWILHNPWRESMCSQLKADLWGYITPGDVRRGGAMIHRLGGLSASKNGLYGGLFMQGCISAALTENPTVDAILRGGLSNIPRTCRLHEAILNVMQWHKTMRNWEEVCDKIYETYGHWYFAGAINNICFIVLSLLEGNLDFEKTICVAVMCGTDTDCNSANAGSVVGAAIGYKALDPKWIAPLNDTVRSCVSGFGFGSITELADRTIAVQRKINE